MSRFRTRLGLEGRALAVLLAVLLAAEAAPAQTVPGPAIPTAGEEPVRALPWLKLDDLAATRDRPLFAQGRRPPPPPPPPAPPAPVASPQQDETAANAKPDLALRGIIRQETGTLVVLEDNDASESVVVRSGDSYGRWRVTALSDESVELADGTTQLRLELYQR